MMIKKNKLFAREQTVEQDLSLSIWFDRLLIMSTCQSFDLIDYNCVQNKTHEKLIVFEFICLYDCKWTAICLVVSILVVSCWEKCEQDSFLFTSNDFINSIICFHFEM